MFGTDLSNWIAGGTRARELADMRRQWNEVEALWRASPLSASLSSYVLEAVRDAIDRAHRRPATPILVACAMAIDALLRAEDIGPLEVQWDVLEQEVEATVRARQMMARRRLWVRDFQGAWAVVRARLIDAMVALFRELPESACEDWDETEPAFGVPLADLIEDLPALLDQWLMSPYDDDTLRLDLLLRLRRTLERNLLVASGFSPGDDPVARQDRLVMPSRHRGSESPAALVELYLAGTPLGPILEQTVPFDVSPEARFEHCHILGGTGHGKTQFMQRLILDDLDQAPGDGRSVIVIDSQGDLINKLMRLELFDPSQPGSLADRLVVIDPTDIEFPAALNLFDAHLTRLGDYGAVDRERVLNGVVELYEVFFGELLGAELTQKQGVIFRYLARLMLVIPDATIHTLMALMEDGRRFQEHMDRLDGSARHFFRSEFFHPSFAATKKQILRRLWGVLSTPAFERMFAQPRNKLDLFEAMRSGKIILVNTAKELLKADGSQLFGRFFIALIAQAALERSTLDPDDRNPVFVYVDEAQEYFDERIETILTQARKYRVGMTLAHQTLDQLTPRLRAAIAANTSLKCAGGVSAKDARAMADELRTSAEFIESMRRRPDRTEFAAWLKNRTPRAVRLSSPLGALERRPQMTEEAFDRLLAANRRRYCGTLAEAVRLDPSAPTAQRAPETPVQPSATRPVEETSVAPPPPTREAAPPQLTRDRADREPTPPPRPAGLGKGGQRHRYLQHLVKELGEQQGFKAVVEAPLRGGQVDVLLTREGRMVAVEISVTTTPDLERENLRKCLDAGFEQVALVLAKSERAAARQRGAILDGLEPELRARVTVLSPEEVPDYIAALAEPPEPSEQVVKGYRVRVSQTPVSPGEARARREALARLVAKSLREAD